MSQDISLPRGPKSRRKWWWAVAATIVAVGLIASRFVDLPHLFQAQATSNPEGGDHDEHNHAEPAHAEVNAIRLSPQAQQNIGLKVTQVALQPFDRTISIPGIVVERPGQSTLQITAPLTGVITSINTILGEAVRSGHKLFDIRITHEELVQVQADFLRTAEELGVIEREIERLDKATQEGAIAGKTLLERKYEQQKLLAVQRAQYQALLLHGLSELQIKEILTSHKLLASMTVAVPVDEQKSLSDIVYQVQDLKVTRGQHVVAGDNLAVLANHGQLLLQGIAFEKDASDLARAVRSEARVTAVFDAESRNPTVVNDLGILYLSGKVDSDSRAFHFYLPLPNELLKKPEARDGHEFINWRFKPGQRAQIKVPVERWLERIVLPVDAVAQDGAEEFVFQQNGDKFERRPVHVEYRDQTSVVIANDGSIFPGDQVAIASAQQLLIEIKNKSGGAVDPHAGHNH